MRLVLPIFAAVVLTACAPPGSPGDHAAPLSLAGTSWTIATIDGRPIKTARPTAVRFTKDRIEGSAGCNSFGGTYTLTGDRLMANQVISTKMACVGSGMDVEAKFFQIIESASVSSVPGGAIEFQGTQSRATLQPAH